MDNTKKSSGSSRVGILDELRGFAIICMVVYHAMYDLKYLFGLDIPIFFDGWFDVIRDIFAGLFILFPVRSAAIPQTISNAAHSVSSSA